MFKVSYFWANVFALAVSKDTASEAVFEGSSIKKGENHREIKTYSLYV